MIKNIFSKRLFKQNNPNIDVYVYNEIPNKLRIQIIYIMEDMISEYDSIWEDAYKIMLRELGKLYLVHSGNYNAMSQCKQYILSEKNYSHVLDIVEVIFSLADDRKPTEGFITPGQKVSVNKAIEELNYRFRESSIGYEYVNKQIIRVDRELTHSEIIKPALQLLYEEKFKGANDEFLKAHEYYREKAYKDAILYAGKAFESTMKTICENNGYKYNKEKDTANKLIQILCEEGLIPTTLQTHFQGLDKAISSIKTTLESGLPTLRNRKGGHGQGDEVIHVPEQFVTYALNLAACNIVLLVDLYKENK